MTNISMVQHTRNERKNIMNNTETQAKLQALKSADIAAYKAGTKSNFVLSFVRDEFIKRAYMGSEDLSKETTVEVNYTIASIIVPSVAVLTMGGQYPALLKKADFAIKDGKIEIKFSINTKELSQEYKDRLNEKLSLAIA